ncbi:TIGR03085 family metal-binding protein [Mycolicibacterium sediminis]|uniref:TIGR03085 family protein n=1 Tax=Mycolicibacterium sediminis TaxID=1286180 RepID=A0A7I7QPE8_9MYCO|nr:TIGR03085 family metal-binding protein [Mycolicibacterium sediminis]BBY27706.1 TIGR03085 family protein [Mycolicibacterium sediminis]
MSVAQAERAGLVAAMREVGPDAPTLCGDWTARDLAAHLVIRERRLDAAPGILVPKLAGYTERVQDQVAAENDWNVLLDKVASGPPTLSPFKLLDPLVNVSEMFIHHEDVRRAGAEWEPRVLDEATTTALTRQVSLMSRLMLSKVPARVTLRTPEGKTLATTGSGPSVVVTGDPGELLLFVSGRDQTKVEITGDDDAVRAVREGRGGL